MRIAFFYPNKCISEAIDPHNIWDSKRGLTGSELTCIKYAIELGKLGHSVNLFTKVPYACSIDGILFLPYEEWGNTYHKQTNWDALISCMNPEPLSIAKSGFKIFNQQVSDFGGCSPGWENHVDILAPLSHSHSRHLFNMTNFPKNKWRVLYNGTDNDEFRPGLKEDGKIIWASSHDRGLHWLLEAFPKIKNQYPKANLHIFYNFVGVRSFSEWQSNGDSSEAKFIEELGRRSRYVLNAINRLSHKDVHCHESVSRSQIRHEMSSSQVLAYPLDPVRYTETFGVTVLEACSSGVIPVLCTADAFGELWSDVSLNVPPPYPDHKDKFIEHVVSALNGGSHIEGLRQRAIQKSKQFSWPVLAKNLETFILSDGGAGLPEVKWV